MPEMIISSSGVQHGLIITPEGAVPISGDVNLGTTWTGVGSVVVSGTLPVTIVTSPVSISGEVQIRGLRTTEIIRKASGSPAIDFIFSAEAESFMIDNLGSAPIYFALSGATANPASDSGGFIDKFTFRSFDGFLNGSISIQSSGTTTTSVVQCIRLT